LITAHVRRGLAAVGVAALALAVAACGGDDGGDATATTAPLTAPSSTDGAIGATAFAYGNGACAPEDRADLDAPVRSFDDAPRRCIDPDATYRATFETSEGQFVVTLDAAGTPGTVNNFVTLARYGYYDDTPIFRADPSIDLFQAGGQDNSSSPGYVIPDEGAGYTYPTGVLAMANRGSPDTGSAQWFVVTGPKAAYLDDYGTFVVFGRITEGLDVAQSITALGAPGGTPTRPIALDTVAITQSPAS
jgi:cyclophilin family peptidyl-prolyl cis-trans isomerase